MDLFQFQFCSYCTTLKSQPIIACYRLPYMTNLLSKFSLIFARISETNSIFLWLRVDYEENQWEFCIMWNCTIYTYSLVSWFSLFLIIFITLKYPFFTTGILCVKMRFISIQIFCIINNIKIIFAKLDFTFLDPFIKFQSQYWLCPFNIMYM